MKKRQKRLVTAVSALFIALLAFASAPDRAVATSSARYCNYMYYCDSDCNGGPCVDEECGASCQFGACTSGHLVICQDF